MSVPLTITKAAKTNISPWLKCGFTLSEHLFIAVYFCEKNHNGFVCSSVWVSHGSEQYLILTFEK